MSDPIASIRTMTPGLIIGRVWTLTTSTFTQLVRMRSFYFILLFALLIAAASNLNLLFSPEQKLRVIKDTSLGAMSMFAWLFAIVATAMLIPRDIEDRTLYTILAKPVSRFEYLLGKLCGVLLTIALALLAMLALFATVLWFREQGILSEQRTFLQNSGRFSAEEIAAELEIISRQGAGLNLLYATWAIFLKSAVLVAMTILISTFASSSLFTIIVGATVFLIGHFHKLAFQSLSADMDDSTMVSVLGKTLGLVIPDFRTFNVVDQVAAGTPIATGVMAAMGLLALFYVVVYSLISLFIFFDKEF